MAEQKKEPPVSFGIFGKSSFSELQPSDIIAIVLSGFWLLAVILFFTVAGGVQQGMDALTFVMVVMAIFMPVAVIWIGAMAARNARVMREESARLQLALDAMRRAYLTQVQNTSMGLKPSFERKLEEIAAAQRQTETAIVTFATREAPKVQPPFKSPPPQMGRLRWHWAHPPKNCANRFQTSISSGRLISRIQSMTPRDLQLCAGR